MGSTQREFLIKKKKKIVPDPSIPPQGGRLHASLMLYKDAHGSIVQ